MFIFSLFSFLDMFFSLNSGHFHNITGASLFWVLPIDFGDGLDKGSGRINSNTEI